MNGVENVVFGGVKGEITAVYTLLASIPAPLLAIWKGQCQAASGRQRKSSTYKVAHCGVFSLAAFEAHSENRLNFIFACSLTCLEGQRVLPNLS